MTPKRPSALPAHASSRTRPPAHCTPMTPERPSSHRVHGLPQGRQRMGTPASLRPLLTHTYFQGAGV